MTIFIFFKKFAAPPPPPPPLMPGGPPPPPPLPQALSGTTMPSIIENVLINPIYKTLPRSNQQLKQFAWTKIPNGSLSRNNNVWKEVNEKGEKVKLDYNLLEELFTKPKIILNGMEEKKEENKMDNKASFKKLPSLNDNAASMSIDNTVNFKILFLLKKRTLSSIFLLIKKGDFS